MPWLLCLCAWVQDGVAAVSQGRTQSGVELLLKAHSRAYGQDLSPAVVLFQYGHCLEGAPVGELLGAKESASLLAAYMACFDFRVHCCVPSHPALPISSPSFLGGS